MVCPALSSLVPGGGAVNGTGGYPCPKISRGVDTLCRSDMRNVLTGANLCRIHPGEEEFASWKTEMRNQKSFDARCNVREDGESFVGSSNAIYLIKTCEHGKDLLIDLRDSAPLGDEKTKLVYSLTCTVLLSTTSEPSRRAKLNLEEG